MTFKNDTDPTSDSWSHQEVARHLDNDPHLAGAAARIVAGPVTETVMANAILRLVLAADIKGVDYTLVDYHVLVSHTIIKTYGPRDPAPLFEVVGSFVFEEDDEWTPTHYSVHDGSGVRLVADHGDTVTVENECGEQWDDPADLWEAGS